VSGIVFAELIVYIEDACQDEDIASVFKLADLAQLYQSRMEQLGVTLDSRVHSTQLKHRLQAQFPDMRAYNQGRDVLLAFQEDVGAALAKACELDRTMMQSILHMLHRLFTAICLRKPSLPMDFSKDVKKNLFLTFYLAW
jgi:hypothetical protein